MNIHEVNDNDVLNNRLANEFNYPQEIIILADNTSRSLHNELCKYIFDCILIYIKIRDLSLDHS